MVLVKYGEWKKPVWNNMVVTIKIQNVEDMQLKETYHIDIRFILFNPLAPRGFWWNFRHAIFKQILVIDGWGISCEIALLWISLDFTNDQSRLVQVMAWCRQATSHYLNHFWPRYPTPYVVTKPQCINPIRFFLPADPHHAIQYNKLT